MVGRVFHHLEAFRKLPDYQLERRLDIFMLVHMDKVLNKRFGTDDMTLIMPEFPIPLLKTDGDWEKVQSINEVSEYDKDDSKHSNLTMKCDYTFFSKKNETIYLVELKTDSGSFSHKQFWHYKYHCSKSNWLYLYRDCLYDQAVKNKQYWRKYLEALKLISGITELSLLTEKECNEYLESESGRGKTKGLEQKIGRFDKENENLRFLEGLKLEFVYVAPTKTKADFDKLNEDLKNLITLADFREVIRDQKDSLAHFLSEMLNYIETGN